MFQIIPTPLFKETCPAFIGGAIEARVANSPSSTALWTEIEAMVAQLRHDYTPDTIKLRSGIAATRAAYKAAGKDPSRYRPACEQLARRVLQGKDLYAVDTIVDLVNLASLSSGYSTAALDADHIEGTLIELDFGREGEPYEGIGRGVLNIGHLPVYRDAAKAFATPTSDSVHTKLTPETHHLLVLINGYDGNREEVERTIAFTERLLEKYAAATHLEHCIY